MREIESAFAPLPPKNEEATQVAKKNPHKFVGVFDFSQFFLLSCFCLFCLSFSSLPLLFDILKPKKVPTRWGLWHIYIHIYIYVVPSGSMCQFWVFLGLSSENSLFYSVLRWPAMFEMAHHKPTKSFFLQYLQLVPAKFVGNKAFRICEHHFALRFL